MTSQFTKRKFFVAIIGLVLASAILVSAHFDFSPVIQASERTISKRYSVNQKGDITLIGNVVITCEDSQPNCAAARNSATNYDNNSFIGHMQYINVDGGTVCPTNITSCINVFDSSSADLNMPVDSGVSWAGLYWGAKTKNLDSSSKKVVLKTPGSSEYVQLTATTADSGDKSYYGDFVDITSYVQKGMNGTYTVGNVKVDPTWTDAGGAAGGWAIIVVYSNPKLPPRNLTVFDGYQNFSHEVKSFKVSGFVAPTTGTITASVGIVAWEGDKGDPNSGDSDGSLSLNNVPLSNQHNPVNNVFNSTISTYMSDQGVRNPNYINTLGVDIDLLSADNAVKPNSTSATFTISTTGSDFISLSAVTTAIDINAPEISLSKNVVDVNGGDLQPGDDLEYTITAKNSGTSVGYSAVVEDPIPANTTYIPGSLSIVSGANSGSKTDTTGDDQANFDSTNKKVVFRIGSGATSSKGGTVNIGDTSVLKFRVKIDAGLVGGTVIKNIANSNYLDDNDFPYNSSSSEVDATLAITDPTAWLMTSNGDASANGGWSNFNIHTISQGSIPSFITNLAGNDPYYLSTFTAATGNSMIDSNRNSKYKFLLTNYLNNVAKLPSSSDALDYYDYIFNLVTKTNTPISSAALNLPANSNLTSQISGLSGTAINVVVFQNTSLPNYKLTISQGFTCNSKAVIFVNGYLDVEPDFFNGSNNSTTGCVFIVKKDITILPGHAAGAGSYDQLQAFFITAGSFITQYDNQEGLLVLGGVQSHTVSFNRKLGSLLNANRPAEWFMLDPRYTSLFGSVLAIRHFSIRTV